MTNLEIFVRPNRGLNPVRRIDDRVSYHSATSPPTQDLDVVEQLEVGQLVENSFFVKSRKI